MLCGRLSGPKRFTVAVCLFRTVLDDAHALTGRARRFTAAGKCHQVESDHKLIM